ncbi:MAG: putative transferase (TIGR04331 family) [Oleiphilaceae bacterium]|jgi:putative transferase (TIGR04331 family)
MFLVTTADKRCLIHDNNELLLLGEWCDIYDKKHQFSNNNHKIMPYPWASSANKKSDFIDIQYLYGRMLGYLKDYLNQVHNVKETEAYWELIIGAWLQLAVAIIYERYRCLIDATSNYSISNTLIFHPKESVEPANDYSDFSEKYIDDEWNLYLYSKIIEFTNMCPFTYIEGPIAKSPTVVEPSKKLGLRQAIKNIIRKTSGLVPEKYTQIYFSNSYFSTAQLIKLQFRLKQVPVLFSPFVEIKNITADWEMRKEILVSEDNQVLKIMAKLIPLLLPKSYLESFIELKTSAMLSFPKSVKLINTAISDIFDDGFKVWAAEQRKWGVPLLINQHGGCYGASELTQAEIFQTKIATKFYSWGWSDSEKVLPMPAPKLVDLTLKKYDPQGHILLILFNHSRYSYWAQSFPIAEQMREYFQEQLIFLENLSKSTSQYLKIRYYPKDFGWCVEKRFSDAGYAEMKDSSATLNEAMDKARLCIATYNATTFLETLSANMPTVIFWKTNHFPLRSSAFKWYEKLKSVGILHDSAISAAEKVNEISDAPNEWWEQPDVQKAKNEFCDHYAMKDDDWLESWATELNSMVYSDK